MKTICIRIREDLKGRVDQAGREAGLRRSVWMRLAFERGLGQPTLLSKPEIDEIRAASEQIRRIGQNLNTLLQVVHRRELDQSKGASTDLAGTIGVDAQMVQDVVDQSRAVLTVLQKLLAPLERSLR